MGVTLLSCSWWKPVARPHGRALAPTCLWLSRGPLFPTHGRFKPEFTPGQRVRCNSRWLHLTDSNILKALHAKPRGPGLNENWLLCSRIQSTAERGSQPRATAGGRCGHAIQSRRESHLVAGGLPGPGPQVAMVLEGSALGFIFQPCLQGVCSQLYRGQCGGAPASALTLIHLQARLLLGGGRWRRKAMESVCGDQTSSL